MSSIVNIETQWYWNDEADIGLLYVSRLNWEAFNYVHYTAMIVISIAEKITIGSM